MDVKHRYCGNCHVFLDDLEQARAMANEKRSGPATCDPAHGSKFLAWMHQNFRGFFYGRYPCWNWKINGVLVTFWLRTGLVKLYHDEGRATECHPAETERCREAVMGMANMECYAEKTCQQSFQR